MANGKKRPRKAAVYLHNLTTILADKGRLAKPARMRYAIPDQPPTMHDMLLQKSDGTFMLVVWNERLKGTDEVTVKFGESCETVRIYDPIVGTESVRTTTAIASLELTLSDHPVIVAIRPK